MDNYPNNRVSVPALMHFCTYISYVCIHIYIVYISHTPLYLVFHYCLLYVCICIYTCICVLIIFIQVQIYMYISYTCLYLYTGLNVSSQYFFHNINYN